MLLNWRLISLLFCLFFHTAVFSKELPDFTQLVESSSPTVVKIYSEAAVQSSDYHDGLPEFLFRRFHGIDPREHYEPEQRQGIGSGIIVESDGYILTNHHVVDGANKIIVLLNDRDEYEATLVGTDPLSDLALIKIEARNLPTVEFSTREIKVGEWVLAIGSPFGLDYTVSQGIVSAKGRSLPSAGSGNYVPFIQTDVAINPGNSGGPLFDLDGKVVGINARIFSRSGGYMGLSFAIPANLAINVMEQLREQGSVSRGWLGVSIQEINKQLANTVGLDKPRGALVTHLIPGSPARNSDLEKGDVILEFNGHPITRAGDLPHVVGAAIAGSEAELKVMRRGKEKTISLTLGELPEDPWSSRPDDGTHEPVVGSALGMSVETADREMLSGLAISGGVVVTEVIPGGPADKAGLIPGDVVTQLGYVRIDNAEDFHTQAASLEKGQPQLIHFFRRGYPAYGTIMRK